MTATIGAIKMPELGDLNSRVPRGDRITHKGHSTLPYPFEKLLDNLGYRVGGVSPCLWQGKGTVECASSSYQIRDSPEEVT